MKEDEKKVTMHFISVDMTLRDYFAAFSLMGLRARTGYIATSEEMSKAVYRDADAMLAERQKK